MTTLYFDCYAGAAGDMIIGALIDAGLSFEELQAGLSGLDLPEVSLRAEKVMRGGLSGTKFHVDIAHHHHDHDHGEEGHHHHHHRHLSGILEMIDGAGLPAPAADLAKRIFTRLGRAEAQAHSIELEKVHFHEVGAADSIVDIIGAALGLHLMGVTRITCNTIPVGSGTVKCAHGILPVPAPATANLLRGLPTIPGPVSGELTTPTAAAIFAETAESFGPAPAMTVEKIGYGAGDRDPEELPNLLRVMIGQENPDGQTDPAVEIEANIDDCSGEVLAAAMDKLREMGCLDVWTSPIYMKKNRPAWTIHVLCHPADVKEVQRVLFSETTTLGVRCSTSQRTKLLRETRTVETAYGPIHMKLGLQDGRVINAAPEFADAQQAASAHGVSVQEVLDAARAAWREMQA